MLLRGKEPKDLDKYWTAHVKEMQAVQDGLKELDKMQLDGDAKATLQKLDRAIPVVGEAYKKALEEFKAAGFDSAAGDKAARGKDRESGALMQELKEKLSQAEVDTSAAATKDANRSTMLALVVMVVVTVIGLGGAVWLSRQIVTSMGQAVDVAKQVADGNLSVPIKVDCKDECARVPKGWPPPVPKLRRATTTCPPAPSSRPAPWKRPPRPWKN